MNNKLFARIFGWMFLGLMITFAIAFYVATSDTMINNIFSTNLYWIIFILEFILVLVLSARAMKMQHSTAAILFCLYSFVSGLTFSVFFLMFSLESILFVFALTGLLFGVFSLLGFYTNIDLSKFSTIFFMGIFGIIIASVVNIFLGSTTFELVISWIAIALFVGMTAYDIQKIKKLYSFGVSQNNLAIIGALELYLDFINIFINLLRLFGNSRD